MVDLDSSEIWMMKLGVSDLLRMVNTFDVHSWTALAHICARLKDPEHMIAIMEFCQHRNMLIEFQKFITDFIDLSNEMMNPSHGLTRASRSLSTGNFGLGSPAVKEPKTSMPDDVQDTLHQIESDFPSAGTLSRTESLKMYMKKKRKDRETYDRALVEMQNQNKTALFLRDAIELWTERFHPSKLWKLVVTSMIQNETTFSNFPAVPALREEVGALASEVCSEQIQFELLEYGLVGSNVADNDEELEYWSSRFSDVFDSSPTNSSSNSSWNNGAQDAESSDNASEMYACERDAIEIE